MWVPSARRTGLRNGPRSEPRQTPPAAVAPQMPALALPSTGGGTSVELSGPRPRLHRLWHAGPLARTCVNPDGSLEAVVAGLSNRHLGEFDPW